MSRTATPHIFTTAVDIHAHTGSPMLSPEERWGRRDGPLSLHDSFGVTMESDTSSRQPTGKSSSASVNHDQSPSQAAMSESQVTTSRSSAAQSVEAQQHTQQLNGNPDDIVNPKNLTEEQVMEKVTDMVQKLKQLEDYQHGNGMKLQKVIGDFYWDYNSFREAIGNKLCSLEYSVVTMKMLKSLNAVGIFKNDDVWFPTYYTYNTMWNYSDASLKLAKSLAEADAVRLLTLNCGHKPYINAIHSKNVYYVIKASLSILHNIAKNPDTKHLFKECKAAEVIMPFINFNDEMLKILAMLTLARIVEEEENTQLIDETGTIKCIIGWIGKALDSPRRRHRGFTPQELTEGLDKLAVNDSNKMKIIEENALPIFLRMLQHDDVREHTTTARAIWTLSFDKHVRDQIIEFPEIVPNLEKLQESTNKNVQTNANGALWIINGENDASRAASCSKSGLKNKSHIFVSYSWSDMDTVYKLRDRLKEEGYAIWIDVEKMGGSTLQAMAEAVENAAVVLVCMSEKYKQSPNCRTEAEYTFQLRKDYIPLMLQKRYRPDGWLGAILGAKLYFDFSGKYPFEKTFQGLTKELRGRGQVSANSSPLDNPDSGVVVESSSSLVAAAPPSSSSHITTSKSHVSKMSREAVSHWLQTLQLDGCIPALSQFDGKLLHRLKQMKLEAPEFFYQCLEKKLKMDLIEILKFTDALESLG
ncbi:hypothetical protein ScPMuIL_002634 [Solemya velum]